MYVDHVYYLKNVEKGRTGKYNLNLITPLLLHQLSSISRLGVGTLPNLKLFEYFYSIDIQKFQMLVITYYFSYITNNYQ